MTLTGIPHHVKSRNLTRVFHGSLRSTFATLARSLLRLPAGSGQTGRTVHAVNDVSISVSEGERVGILGRNGAGKTTLLHLIAGQLTPTSGVIDVNGRVSCIMTLGIGMRDDLTGRQCIYTSGEVNGKTRKQTDAMIEDIIAFADVGEFIDYPVKTYSSGMKARLAFAMITFIEPEVLLIDEALSVGDAQFTRKAAKKVRELCANQTILMVVSHSLEALRNICNRCLWLEDGKIRRDDSPEDVTREYQDDSRRCAEREMAAQFRKRVGGVSHISGFEIKDVACLDANGTPRMVFDVGDTMTIRASIYASRRVARPDLRLIVERTDGVVLLDNHSHDDGLEAGALDGDSVFQIPMGPMMFGMGTYEVRLQLLDRERSVDSRLLAENTCILRIENPNYQSENPVIWMPFEWSIESGPQLEND